MAENVDLKVIQFGRQAPLREAVEKASNQPARPPFIAICLAREAHKVFQPEPLVIDLFELAVTLQRELDELKAATSGH